MGQDQSKLRLRFLGAAQTVTGSKYLLTFNERKILIDCGLFQGLKELRLKNWDRFPIDPSSIDAVVLTHAHIDHSGLIPKLLKEGFKGKIHCTPPTKGLCQILLPDTGFLQEEEAEWLNRKHLSKHAPALALFTKEDALESLKQFQVHQFDEAFEVIPGLKITFRYAGHILGAASVIVEGDGKIIAFTGDIGRLNDPILYPPAHLPRIDYLVTESTYGNRIHPETDIKSELKEIIQEASQKKGVILIPAFTVGRAQALMHYLAELKNERQIPSIPIFLNSPMATNVTDLFCEFKSQHKLTEKECDDMCGVVHYVKSVEESKSLNLKHGPMIIISASGMATGGRILHHLKAFAPDPRNTIILAGFQASGTRGRQIQDGFKEIKIHREFIPVRATVRSLENISAHADSKEIVHWLKESQVHPKAVFITHGEPSSAEALSEKVKAEFGWNTFIPKQDQEFTLE